MFFLSVKAARVNINASSSEINGATHFEMRGTKTISSGNNALW